MKALIAGGGTGGHLYPGIAIAEEILARQSGNDVLFVGTKKGIEARVVPELGYSIEYIDVAGLKGRGLVGLIRGACRLPVALAQSLFVVRRFRPDVAVGVGGYASGPVILAAWLLRLPTAILEQNAIPGVTNRVLAKICDAVYVMFDASAAHFPRRKVHALGNPIRRAFLENYLSPRRETNERFTVLVLGGSQGAHALNVRVLEAAEALAQRGRVPYFVHQTGKKDFDFVRTRYAELGIDAEVRAFIDDMSAAYRSADLVVCRSGATTLAELLVARKASLLVPFPHAADNHQEHNAANMVALGASRMFREGELGGSRLADEIDALERDRAAIEAMEQAAGRGGRPEAAREIIDACVELIARSSGR